MKYEKLDDSTFMQTFCLNCLSNEKIEKCYQTFLKLSFECVNHVLQEIDAACFLSL